MMDERTLAEYTPTPGMLKERVVLVTGAGDGIGRAASRAFAGHGATVILLGRTVAKLESTYDAITAAGGPVPAIYPLDLAGATPDDYRDLAGRLEDEFGRLDGLLHNAGHLGSLTPLDQQAPAEWSLVLLVNVSAPFLLTQATLPLLKAADDASIIFTSSGVGRRGRAYWGAYSVSKFAVEGLTQVLADELDSVPGLRANVINPGPTRTRMRAAAFPAEDPRKLRAPEEIMGPYLYLIGPDSRGVNGESIDAQ